MLFLVIPISGIKCEESEQAVEVLLNFFVITPKKCIEIGGNCCKFISTSWDDGIKGKLWPNGYNNCWR